MKDDWATGKMGWLEDNEGAQFFMLYCFYYKRIMRLYTSSHISTKVNQRAISTSRSTMASRLFLFVLLVASCSVAMASDPSPLQDFCVAAPKSRVFVNGEVCKDPNLVRADDFFFRGLHVMGDTSNAVGSNVTTVTVAELPGLNTFGISMARSIEVGFVTSNPETRLITKGLHKGDVFVFPQGLVHFQRNVGNGYAVAIAALSSQNPGAITIANAVFGSNPDINADILAKAFQVDKNVDPFIEHLSGFVLASTTRKKGIIDGRNSRKSALPIISRTTRVHQITSSHFSTMASQLLLIGLILASCSLALASDSSPLQDFCVADPNSQVLVNGVVCKDPELVQADDFLFRGLQLMGNTSNVVGSNVTQVFVAQLPGLNTFGISMARIDFAPQGINPPHTHPRATEILVVISGSIEVGFVTSNPDNRLFTKVLEMGDVFVFPQGLIHFQRNVGHGYAVAIAGLSSQNPGAITIANAVFGSNPDINGDILAKAFQVDKNVLNVSYHEIFDDFNMNMSFATAYFITYFSQSTVVHQRTSFHFSTMASQLLLIGLFVASCSLALASDPSPLQDFCVADPNSQGKIVMKCREML
ncbi:hypothetical protein OSB04_015716 [Centaurea solstitialis]|uniref:Cupin type-1 domain-containing protein n=1 Tax=Centaurea solstitialis TaxID=347529 RepID=A0AA38TCW3_9ASTR|nr:hypothetical protein OSB04_015716 [Centaurea solstitialis]